jgi:hypothetical protein
MDALHVEIERDSITDLCDLDADAIRTLAYPRHRHGKALIDSLIAEGFIAARTGGWALSDLYSYGDYPLQARNGWEEGISLFRVPTRMADCALFGDHSADSVMCLAQKIELGRIQQQSEFFGFFQKIASPLKNPYYSKIYRSNAR